MNHSPLAEVIDVGNNAISLTQDGSAIFGQVVFAPTTAGLATIKEDCHG